MYAHAQPASLDRSNPSTIFDDPSFSLHTFRLKPGDDLKRGIANYIAKYDLRAVSILTCVGSLRQVNIRLASERNGSMSYYFRDRDMFEIVSLVGTFENLDDRIPDGHVHISLADARGNVVGGHLMKGSIVYTTAEVTVIDNHRQQFKRAFDKSTGFRELVVEERSISKSIVTREQADNLKRADNPLKSNLFKNFHSILTLLDLSENKDAFDDILE